MALKADRYILETDTVGWVCDTATERGVVLTKQTSGSGVSIGDSRGTATLASNQSGYKVIGVLMDDVVSIDETRYHRNFHKDEQKVGEPVCILRKGTISTNKILGTPDVGDTAYLTSSGNLTPTLSATGGLTATPKVGMFMSKKDADGYARVDVNLPVV